MADQCASAGPARLQRLSVAARVCRRRRKIHTGMPGCAWRRKRVDHSRETVTAKLLPHSRRRRPIRAGSNRIARVLSRLIGEHLVPLLSNATQSGRVIDLLPVLIRIACETGLLSARFLGRANLVCIFLWSHLV